MKTVLAAGAVSLMVLTANDALAFTKAECVSLRSKINKLKQKNCVQSEHPPGVQFFLTPAEVQCIQKTERKILDKCDEYEYVCVRTRKLGRISVCSGGGRGGRGFSQVGAPLNRIESCDAWQGCRPSDTSTTHQYHFDPSKDGNRVGDPVPPGTTRIYEFGNEE